jgi:hypothetical protein
VKLCGWMVPPSSNSLTWMSFRIACKAGKPIQSCSSPWIWWRMFGILCLDGKNNLLTCSLWNFWCSLEILNSSWKVCWSQR